jgi:hypothetical protein
LLFRDFDAGKQSLNDHVIQLSCEGNKVIRKQSLDERFNDSSVEFIKKVLIDQLQSCKHFKKLPFLDLFDHVFIQDSTKFKLPHSYKSDYPGYHQAGASIQLVLDIKQSQFSQISIHPQTCNDVTEADNVEWMPTGSLIIRDLGYFSVEGFKAIEESNCFFLSRLQPRSALFQFKDDCFIRFDINKLLRRMKKYKLPYVEEQLYLTHQYKHPVRVCFFLVPASVRRQRLKEKNRYNKNRGWQQSKEYNVWTWFNAFVTNADNITISTDAIPGIYKYRWQIELVFKTWKSNYSLEKMKSMKVERMECYLYSLLLKTVMHRNIMNLCSNLIMGNAGSEREISFIKFTKLIMIFDRIVVQMFRQFHDATEVFIMLLNRQNKEMLHKEIKKKRVNFNTVNK